MRFAIWILSCLLAPLPALAQACGGPDAPCEIEGGRYHALTPDGAGPHPAMIFMHGWGGTGNGVVRNRGLVGPILERGYAVIAPQGEPRRPGDSGGSWNTRLDPEKRDDVVFVREVVEDASARFGIDRGRVLAAGFSGGGMMTWRIACDAPGDYAAYAPVSGLLWRPLPQSCAGPMRMLHTHGWSDPVVPMEGRSVAGGRITQGDLFEGLDLLREAMGCARDDPDGYAAREPFLIRRWTDCATGARLEMALHPAGHRVPQGWSALALDWFEGLAPQG